MSGQELKRAFAEAVAEVKPLAAPYQRLMERRQTQTWRRMAGWVTGGVAAVAAVLLGPVGLLGPAVGPQPTPHPSPTTSTAPVDPAIPARDPYAGWAHDPATPWVKRLVDSPARGALGKDKAWNAEMVTALQKERESVNRSANVRILFADDIGTLRVVIAAHMDKYGDDIYVKGAVAVAERGATPERLAKARPVETRDEGRVWMAFSLTPFTRVALPENLFPPEISWRGYAEVALAPAGCLVETSGIDRPVAWKVQPGSDYAVRAAAHPLVADRVSCDGKVRTVEYGGLSSMPFVAPGIKPTSAEVAAAVKDARGEFTLEEAASALAPVNFVPELNLFLPERALPQVLYGGDKNSNGWQMFLLAERRHDVTTLTVNGMSGTGTKWTQSVSNDVFTDPKGIVAVPVIGELANETESTLILAPRNAVKLKNLATGKETSLVNGVGKIQVNGPERVVAYDQLGNVVGEGTAPTPQYVPPADGIELMQWEE